MKKQRLSILISALLFVFAICIPVSLPLVRLSLFVAAYLPVALPVIQKAVRGITRGEVFDENFLMTIATFGAFILREYPEAVAVMLLYQIGELFQAYAVRRSRRSIASLMDIRPEYAMLLTEQDTVRVAPEAVKVGDTIRVCPGEKIPLDSVVIDGFSTLDTAALTGESLPQAVEVGDAVCSGCINLSGVLTLQVTKTFGESTVSKILELVENAASRKAKTERFVTRFAAVYTPIVVGAAVLLACLPPLLFPAQTFSVWIYRALSFLMVSCPCALVISVPLTYFGGIGGASRMGILLKGGNYLESLAQTKIAVFDKTGTLTTGTFTVQDIQSVGYTKDQLLFYAAHAEGFSHHPIAASILQAYGKPLIATVQLRTETAGQGVCALVDGDTVLVGNSQLLDTNDIAIPQSAQGTVFVAINGVYAGCITIADSLRAGAKEMIDALKKAGIRTVMLTGDTIRTAQAVAHTLGIDTVYAQLLPADKVAKIEALIKAASKHEKVLFLGDGINDAPVLARADIGVAMGGIGSDAAIEAADVVLMTDEVQKLLTTLRIAKKTRRIVRQNVIFALGVKIAVLLLTALGITGMWAAVVADVGVSILAICNALRMLRKI